MLRKMSTTASGIARKLKEVTDKVQAAASKRPEHLQYVAPRLVAVSKTKSISMIMEAYDAGQRHFGENYVVEIFDKSHDIELQDHCENIKWHFIGHLQRNKVSKLLDVPNLYMIETVDSERLAKSINDAWGRINKPEPIRVMVQVNTSNEESKSGCLTSEVVKLVQYIIDHCPHIKLVGLMTIGSFDHDPNAGMNPDFESLVKIREEVCNTLNILKKDVELSMGMSADYEQAISMGSTNVRVGSTIFGARDTPHPYAPAEPVSVEDEGSDGTKSDTEKMVKVNLQLKDFQGLALS